MILSKKQKAILYSLYKDYMETGIIKTFVSTKGVTVVTMRSLLKTGFIETDKAIKGVPSNMRLTEKGIEAMIHHTKLQRDTVDGIIYNNKEKINNSERCIEKVSALATHLCDPKITITDLSYGVFSVRKGGGEETFYEVYTPNEYAMLHPTNFIKSSGNMYISKVKLK